MKKYDKTFLLNAYRKMATIRAYETKVEEIFLAGELPGISVKRHAVWVYAKI